MRFATQVMDPPWPEYGGGKIKRGADRHYPLIRRKKDIAKTVLDADLWNPAEDAHLWIWATNTFLPWGIDLFEMLGFRYVTNWPWIKPGMMGLGQYGRGCHELLLFGVRGKGYNACQVNPPGHKGAGRRVTIRTDYLVGAPRVLAAGKVVHSAKPERSYELIEARSIGPYVEFFARGKPRSDQWQVWGNEAV